MKYLIAILMILTPLTVYAADGTINDQTALGARPATDDTFPIWGASAGATKKVTYLNLIDIPNLDGYGGLTAAVAAIGSTVTTVYCDSAQTVSDDLSVPTTMTIIAAQECSMNPASTKTLTINSSVIAGDYSITGGSGTVTFSGGGIIWDSWTNGTAKRMGIGMEPARTLDLYEASGNITARTDSDSLTAAQQSSWQSQGTGNSAARLSEIGVVYYDQSGAGGTNAPAGYLYLQEGDSNNAYLWVDDTGDLRISDSAGNRGSTNGTVVGDQSSDERTKQIESGPFPYGIDTVMQLDPIAFERYGIRQLGFGAQRTQPIVPEVVYDTKSESLQGKEKKNGKWKETKDKENTRLAMRYVQIIPILTKAIQELRAALCSEHPTNDLCQ